MDDVEDATRACLCGVWSVQEGGPSTTASRAGATGSCCHERREGRDVLGVSTAQGPLGPPHAVVPHRPEAALAEMEDEGAVVEDMNEARLEGAEAEVHFLAVAEAERVLVEQADARRGPCV